MEPNEISDKFLHGRKEEEEKFYFAKPIKMTKQSTIKQ